MKILYVLVSNDKDFYCEQALISIMSLKHQMPKAFISLLVDSETSSTFLNNRSKIKDYVSEFIEISLDNNMSPLQKSRFLKTKMREYIQGDFLYVDVDTVWAEPIDDKDFTSDIMGVPDAHCLLEEHPSKNWIKSNLKSLGFCPLSPWHINSGVLFVRDNNATHSFFKEWHLLWQHSCNKNIPIDQPALNQANENCGNTLSLLPSYYNAQINRNLNVLAKAKIIHYYASWNNNVAFSPAYKFLQSEFLLKIKKGDLSQSILDIIHNPKEAFDGSTYVLNEKSSFFWQTQLCRFLIILHNSEKSEDKKLFTLFNRYTEKVARIYYRIIPYLVPFYKRFAQNRKK